jgi:single-strand DNA-binding protein
VANETTMTVVGNLTADPDLRFTKDGTALARFSVASTPRVFDKTSGQYRDGEPLFLNCTAWRELAENVATSLTKGARVVVTGRLRQHRWETPEGEKRSAYGLEVDEIGPSLRFATTRVQKLVRSNGNADTPPDDPWMSGGPTGTEPAAAATGTAFTDEPPF